MGQAQKTNFAPRVGFAERLRPDLVLRGGYGIAYGALANIGYGGTLGQNYPFIYNIAALGTNTPVTPITLSNGQTATIENTFGTINLSDPTQITGLGVSLYGRQYNYQTPYVQTFNLTLQDQFALTIPSRSAVWEPSAVTWITTTTRLTLLRRFCPWNSHRQLHSAAQVCRQHHL